MNLFRIIVSLLVALSAPVGRGDAAEAVVGNPPDGEVIVLPRSVPDPIEPFNRCMWALNRELMKDVIKPTSKVYRFVVRKPLRQGIGNFGRNITYPGRLVNHLLQARWRGARDETDRFFCNTIAGGAGFIDVASRWHIPKSEADFGQTLGRWGWRPGCYLMLPVFGPSNERDAIGLVADNAANPLSYLTPYSITTENPLTFLSPYMYFSYAVTYNNLSDSVDGYVRMAGSETDPYYLVQYAWTFVRKDRTPDLQAKGELDPVSLETLQAAVVSTRNKKFFDRGGQRSARIPSTGKRLPYTCWLQPRPAPVVYIVPGLGSHRKLELPVALAELVFSNGFSVVSVSSPYNPEFMEHASTAALPAYTPVDAHDLHVALTAIDRQLARKYSGRLQKRAIMGYSMGAFEALFIAAAPETNQPALLKFDRSVAIDTPVRLTYGISKLDEFYEAPLAWPAADRTKLIENLFLKLVASGQGSFTPGANLSLGSAESKFLIGLSFRLILRDVIFASQRRVNLGVLHEPLHPYRRKPAYDEISQFAYRDYFQKFAVPYYQSRNIDLAAPNALESAGDLKTQTENLRANPDVRVIVNQNDFLLTAEDLAWLQSTFGRDRFTTFEHGGHLGNLGDTNVQSAIVRALDGLRH